jgi:hypothetical protein
MKIQLELEIESIDEDGNLDEELQNNIQSKVIQKVSDLIFNSINKNIFEKIENSIDLKVGQLYEDFLNTPFNIYDKWGEIIKENVDVKEMLKEKFDKFITEKVDGNGGKTYSCDQFRYEYILNHHTSKMIDEFLRKVNTSIIDGLRKYIDDQAREKIVNSILSDSKIKKFI